VTIDAPADLPDVAPEDNGVERTEDAFAALAGLIWPTDVDQLRRLAVQANPEEAA
jgi:hypothetical protein